MIVLDFDPAVGQEQFTRRPALVVSPAAFNRTFGLAFVAPVTSTLRGHAFEIVLPDGLPVAGGVLMHQTKSLDWRRRRAQVVGKAPAAVTSLAIDILERILKPG